MAGLRPHPQPGLILAWERGHLPLSPLLGSVCGKSQAVLPAKPGTTPSSWLRKSLPRACVQQQNLPEIQFTILGMLWRGLARTQPHPATTSMKRWGEGGAGRVRGWLRDHRACLLQPVIIFLLLGDLSISLINSVVPAGLGAQGRGAVDVPEVAQGDVREGIDQGSAASGPCQGQGCGGNGACRSQKRCWGLHEKPCFSRKGMFVEQGREL